MKSLGTLCCCFMMYAILDNTYTNSNQLYTCSLLRYGYDNCMKQAKAYCGLDPDCKFKSIGRKNVKTHRGNGMIMYIEFNKRVY